MTTEKLSYKPNGLQAWFLASRPKTLTASIAPLFVSTMLAISQGFAIDWTLLLFTLLSAFCIQIATNIINDALDFKKGSDTSERLGPQRVTQSGWLTMQQMLTG